MRFIGHLDLMRFFQRALRRAHIPVAYSKGFSPHQLMSFASPLGIGLTSEAEYMDIVLDMDVDSFEKDSFRNALNEQMNDEIFVSQVLLLPDTAKPSMSYLAACDYIIFIKNKAFDRSKFSKESFCDFFSQQEINILKKTKRSEKTTDIRPYIYIAAMDQQQFAKQLTEHGLTSTVKYQGEDWYADLYPMLYLQLTAGSVTNLKPDLVVRAWCEKENISYNPLEYQMHRLQMYADQSAKKGELHLWTGEIPCQLIPLSAYRQ